MSPTRRPFRSFRGLPGICQNLIVSAAGLVVFLALAEALLRLSGWEGAPAEEFKFVARQVHGDLEIPFNEADPRLMWRPKPGYDAGIVQINAGGYRGRLSPRRKPAGTIRILCLGDSSTFGWRLPAELAYPGLLERLLNAAPGRAGARYEVVNFGVTGYTSAQGLELYREKGTLLSPDVVVFAFGVNDPVKSYARGDAAIIRASPPRLLVRLDRRLASAFRLYRVMRAAAPRRAAGALPGEARVPRVSPDEYRRNILELYALCRERGASLVLLSPPLCKERDFQSGDRFLPSRRDIIAYRAVLEETAAAAGITLVSPDELTERSPDPTEGYFFDVVHPNRRGHELVAARLFAAIRGLPGGM